MEPMKYEWRVFMYKSKTIYYPQSEIHTPLIPVASGCPHNKCKFCSMYKEQTYEELDIDEIEYELKNIGTYTEKIFITGADPLAVGYEKMMLVLKKVKKYAPYCACVAAYAAVRSIAKYSTEELKNLHEAGLRLLYIGFESGWDQALDVMGKGHTAEMAVLQGKKLNEAKIQFNSIIMYGIAGKGNGVENAIKTAEMLNQFDSYRIVTMNLTIFELTELAQMVKDGTFVPADTNEKVLELKTLLEHLDVKKKTIFDATHTTNMIKMEGNLPMDKERLLKELPLVFPIS